MAATTAPSNNIIAATMCLSSDMLGARTSPSNNFIATIALSNNMMAATIAPPLSQNMMAQPQCYPLD
jgi:hypothetical protein